MQFSKEQAKYFRIIGSGLLLLILLVILSWVTSGIVAKQANIQGSSITQWEVFIGVDPADRP